MFFAYHFSIELALESSLASTRISNHSYSCRGLFLEGYVVKRAPNTTEPALLLENGTPSNLYMLFSDAASCDKWLEALKTHIDWANNHPGDREAAVPVMEQESSRSSISMLKRLPRFF